MCETQRAHADRIDASADHTEQPQCGDREPLAVTAGYHPSWPVIPEEIDSADEPSEDLENNGEEGAYQRADRNGNIFSPTPSARPKPSIDRRSR